MTDATTAPPRDGRTRRGDRSREAIVSACRALMRAGNFRPTVVAISEAAACAPRTVFQHYARLEDVHEAALDGATISAVLHLILPDGGELQSDLEAYHIAHAAVFGRPIPAA